MRANLITGPRYPNQRKIDKMQENRLEIDKKIDKILYSGKSENLRKPEYDLMRQKSGRKPVSNYPQYISHINSHQMIQIERQKTRIQKRIDEIEKNKSCTRSVWPHTKFTLEPMDRSTPIEPIKSDPLVRKLENMKNLGDFGDVINTVQCALKDGFNFALVVQFRPAENSCVLVLSLYN